MRGHKPMTAHVDGFAVMTQQLGGREASFIVRDNVVHPVRSIWCAVRAQMGRLHVWSCRSHATLRTDSLNLK